MGYYKRFKGVSKFVRINKSKCPKPEGKIANNKPQITNKYQKNNEQENKQKTSVFSVCSVCSVGCSFFSLFVI
jgi:hypothetical protein